MKGVVDLSRRHTFRVWEIDYLNSCFCKLFLIRLPFFCSIPIVSNKKELCTELLACCKFVHIILRNSCVNILDTTDNLNAIFKRDHCLFSFVSNKFINGYPNYKLITHAFGIF